MRRLFAAMAAILFLAGSASAGKLYSATYGNWELYAWQQRISFCALKSNVVTAAGTGSMQLRYQTQSNPGIESDQEGYTLVIHDSGFFFRNYAEVVEISFDGEYWTSEHAWSYDSTTNQLFIYFGYDDAFLEWFQAANSISVRGPSVDWTFNLVGTSLLGDYLRACVNEYGF